MPLFQIYTAVELQLLEKGVIKSSLGLICNSKSEGNIMEEKSFITYSFAESRSDSYASILLVIRVNWPFAVVISSSSFDSFALA